MEPHTLAIVLKSLSMGIAAFVIVMLLIWICKGLR